MGALATRGADALLHLFYHGQAYKAGQQYYGHVEECTAGCEFAGQAISPSST